MDFDRIDQALTGSEITDRTTVLRLRDGRRVHIPNSAVANETVTVLATDQARRSSVEFGVAADTDIALLERSVLHAIAGASAVHSEPPASVRVRTLGDDAASRCASGTTATSPPATSRSTKSSERSRPYSRTLKLSSPDPWTYESNSQRIEHGDREASNYAGTAALPHHS